MKKSNDGQNITGNQTNIHNYNEYGKYPPRIVDTLQRIEEKTGVDMRGVDIHMNSHLPAKVQAGAYAAGGSQVYLAPGQERHLNHELGHIVQQRSGLVKATGRINGKAVNDDRSLERQASEIGRV